ncbi:MAG: aminopeptidase P family protein [Chloroflexi bacterium]|nr:aminopeptidase P family protein [Chloroflexota bacterium]
MADLPQERIFGAVFPNEEYDERRRKVRERMGERGIDVLYVSSPKNITYLSGFDIIWFYHASPTGLVVRADSEKVLFFDSYHKRTVNDFSYIDEAVFYATFPFHPTGPQLDTVINTMKGRGLLKGTIGIEKWAHAPSPAMMQAMEEQMSEAGAKVVDGSWIVDTVGLTKSPLEIACIKKAAEIADIGIEAGLDAAVPGVTELEVNGAMQYAMAKAGGEETAIRCVLSKEGFRMPHKPSTRLRLEAGEMIFADVCGVYNRYHADLCRFFCLGEPSDRAKERMKVLADSIPYVQEKVKLGDPPTAIGEAIDEYLASMGLTGEVDRGGYDLGLSTPPDWVGHTRVVGGGFVDEGMELGFVTNYEIFSRGDDTRDVGLIDTLVMTEQGLEVLSNLPMVIMTKGR